MRINQQKNGRNGHTQKLCIISVDTTDFKRRYVHQKPCIIF